jgi:hypothetical protein
MEQIDGPDIAGGKFGWNLAVSWEQVFYTCATWENYFHVSGTTPRLKTMAMLSTYEPLHFMFLFGSGVG